MRTGICFCTLSSFEVDRATCLEEAVLPAGVEDGAADLVSAAGHVDDGQQDSGDGGRLELVGRQDEAVRDRRRVCWEQLEHVLVLHGCSEEGTYQDTAAGEVERTIGA